MGDPLHGFPFWPLGDHLCTDHLKMNLKLKLEEMLLILSSVISNVYTSRVIAFYWGRQQKQAKTVAARGTINSSSFCHCFKRLLGFKKWIKALAYIGRK